MALQKALKHTSGIDMTYWRIVKVDTDYNVKSGTILVYGYVDKASRDAGNSQLGYKTIRFDDAESNPVFTNYFSIDKINANGKNPIKNGYDYIKSIPDGDFSDAMDIIE